MIRTAITLAASILVLASGKAFSQDAREVDVAASCPPLFAGRSMPDGPGIYVATADGEAKRLTDGQFDLLPSWSPDGSKIAFASVRGSDMEELQAYGMSMHWMLYAMTADGSNLHRVTATPLATFTWSPDGKRFAYLSSVEDERNYRTSDPGWTSIAVFVMDADGSAARRLTPTEGVAMSPSWSPDGRQIAFAGDLSGRAGRPSMDLYKVDVDGGEAVGLAEDPGVGVVQWSPRGDMIAFTRFSRPQSSEAVFVIGEDGTGERMLEEGARLVSWLANGEAVLVTSGRELWTIDVSSGVRSERSDQPESFFNELPCQNGLHEIIGRRLMGR